MTNSEQAAIDFLKIQGGSCLVTAVPDKNEKGVFGEIVAGMTTYRQLQRKGCVNITEEEPDGDGFTYTNTIELLKEKNEPTIRHSFQ